MTRTGIQTSIVEQIDEESQGTRVIARALIPWVRPRNITFTGSGFFPNTKVYVYFDGTAVSQYVTPESNVFTIDGADPVEGSQLVTSANGT